MENEELSRLLRTSYSNNVSLIDIDKKMRKNNETIMDMEALLHMRDAKEAWTMTTINMVLTSALSTGVAKLAFDMSNKDSCSMLLALSAGCIALGYYKYKEELQEQERLRHVIFLNDSLSKDEDYDKQQLKELRMKQKALIEARKKIVSEEEEIRKKLEEKEKILVK